MLCKKGTKHRVFQVGRSLRSVGRAVGRRRRKSIVNQVMKDVRMRNVVVEKVGKLVKKEMIYTCSQDAKSMYGNKCLEDLRLFQWSTLAYDMRWTMPTLFRILQLCITKEEGKDIVTAFIGGVILKQHNERMTFLQCLFSILLYSSHSPKQVLLHDYNC